MADVTLVVKSPHMKGDVVKSWQQEVKAQFKKLDIDCPIVIDGDYGVASRDHSASLCYALGIDPGTEMKNGVTPELRTKIRNRRLTDAETKRFKERANWRQRLRDRYESAAVSGVHRPVVKIITDSWGYHPGVHDGVDVITQPNAVCFAMVKSRIIDVRAGGWWGKAPSGDVTKGDGIVQMEVLETVGPFKKGYHIGYGHQEKAVVREGQVVEAGDKIGHAGLAVAWHIHLMVNTGNTSKGIGNIDPRPLIDYAVKYG